MGAQGYIGRAPGDSSVIVARQTFTPTGITTNFTFASGYTVGYVDAYLNGARLIEGDDYTATDGSVVGLTTHAINGDVLELVVYKAFNATNVQAAKDDFSVGGDATITGSLTVGGVEVQPGAAGTWASYDTNTGISTTKKVKIENNLEVTGAASTFSGNLTVGGVLTYDDVTNVDAVGYATFRSGINVQGAGSTTTTLNVTGVSTFQDNVDLGDSDRLRFGAGQDLQIFHNSSNNNSVIAESGSGNLNINANRINLQNAAGNETLAVFREDDSVSLNYDNSKKFETTATGTIITGIATVTEGLVLDGQNGTGKGLRLDLAGSGDYIIQERTTNDVVQFGGTGSSNFFVHNISSGRIGIGQTNPQGDLHIGDISGNKDFIMHSANNGTARIRFREGGSTDSGFNEYSFGMVGSANAMTVNGQGAGEIIRIEDDNNGRVGIATDDPLARLHIHPDTSSDTVPGVLVRRDWGSTSGAMVQFDGSPATGDGNVLFVKGGGTRGDVETFAVRNGDGTTFVVRGDGNAAIAGIVTASNGAASGAGGHFGNIEVGFDNTFNTVQTRSSATLHLNFDTGGDVEACRSGGNFLVGNGGSALIVGPSGFCTATQFDATSDVTLKENIAVIDEPINKLSELKGVTFDWKAGGHSVGVIAQDVEKVLPTAVGGSEDRKTVNYNAIIGLLVESVKDQQKQIEELKSLLDK